MKRLSSSIMLLSLASFLFTATSAEALFIDQLVMRWKKARLVRYNEEISRIPLFNRKFWGLPANNVLADQGTYNQRLNHFNKSDTRTFPQRYWVNSSYAAGNNAPVFYSICGESRCTPGDGFAVQLAKEYRAHVVTLEHRYYGDSVPTSTYSAANLQFLSTEQALVDLSEFQAFIQEKNGLGGPWISIGGSYPGSLSAYYRLVFPKKIIGALASSAPVEARAEFEEYDFQIATAVSPNCRAVMQKVTAEIENDLRNSNTRGPVKALFGSSEVRDDVDFLYIVADMAALAVQYGSREKFCSAIENASNPKAAYAKEGLALFDWFGMKPIEDTAQGNMSVDPSQYRNSGMRQWLYQSCTDYGYWQVAYHDPKLSSRSAQIDLPFHNEICNRMFGIRGTVDTRRINQRFYEPILHGKSTNTLFTNGSEDPWQHLSVTPARRNVPTSVKSILISGAAHCDDLGGSKNPATLSAQNGFRSLVKSWLSVKGFTWGTQERVN